NAVQHRSISAGDIDRVESVYVQASHRQMDPVRRNRGLTILSGRPDYPERSTRPVQPGQLRKGLGRLGYRQRARSGRERHVRRESERKRVGGDERSRLTQSQRPRVELIGNGRVVLTGNPDRVGSARRVRNQPAIQVEPRFSNARPTSRVAKSSHEEPTASARTEHPEQNSVTVEL